MLLIRLTLSQLRHHRIRGILTATAIALSVSLVVAVTSGYRTMEQAALQYLNRYMGAADAIVQPVDAIQGSVSMSVLDALRADPDVRQASGRLYTSRNLQRAAGQEHDVNPEHVAAGASAPDQLYTQIVGIRPPDDSTDSMQIIKGTWFTSNTGQVCVLDQVGAEKLGVDVGDEIVLPGLRPFTLKIVGIVHKPTFFAERQASMYVPLSTLQADTGQDNPPVVSMISVNLYAAANHNAFKDKWTSKFAREMPAISLHMRRDNAGEVENKLSSVHILSYLGGLIAVLTATFITFSALSMGVTERQRILGMMRAIGATRWQVFRLVGIEGIVLAVVGIIVGIPIGMLWMHVLHHLFRDLLWAGVRYSVGGILFAAGTALLSAIAASLLPAWWASRLSPLEAINSHTGLAGTWRIPWKLALIGLLLVLVEPALFFGPLEPVLEQLHVRDPTELARNIRFFGHFIVGLPGIVFGYFLMAPVAVAMVERICTPIVALIMGVKPALIRQQLSAGIWRAAGTAAALTVGLATLIALQTQGHTLIGGWKLPDRFPDIFIWSPDPISWQDQKLLAGVPGVAPGTMMPIVVTTPLGDSKTSLALEAAMSGNNIGVMFFAVDPRQAVKMIDLEFRDNDGRPFSPQEQPIVQAHVVREELKGHRVIVTDEFRQAKHLKIGDTIQLQTSLNGWQTYTISGIVWSPGADVVVSMFDLGHTLDQQTAGSVFGTIEDAKKDFGTTGSHLFAANLKPGLDKTELLKQVQKALGDRGLSAGDVRQIKYNIEQTFYRLLALISTVAFSAMAVASLGVANTIMASVRSRRWQFGVLRSIGVSRAELLRMILAESIMLGATGVVLGLLSGLELAVDARMFSGTVLGYSPALVIPWMPICLGCAAIMVVSLAASLWPATSVARSQPLELLQAGRAST